MSDVDQHRLDGVIGETEVASPAEMESKLTVATECGEHCAGDQRSLIEGQAIVLPHVTEEVRHRVAHHLSGESALRRRTVEEHTRELATRREPNAVDVLVLIPGVIATVAASISDSIFILLHEVKCNNFSGL